MTPELDEILRRTADPAVHRAAAAWRADPWCIAVVGRTSAGKSTLVSRAVGRLVSPVGLGGVTTEVVEIRTGPTTWLDTPGIDGADAAIASLLPVMARSDAVAWVIDGLQPLTSTERVVLRAILPAGLPVVAVVSRLDLLGDEAPSVLQRVRTLLAPWAPRDVWAADLRGTGALPASLLARHATPGRDGPLRSALEALARELAALPTDADWSALRVWWQRAARAEGASADDLATALLARPEVARSGRALLLPAFTEPAKEPVLSGWLGGEATTRRAEARALHRWAMEVDLRLVEHAEAGRGEDREELAALVRAFLPFLDAFTPP